MSLAVASRPAAFTTQSLGNNLGLSFNHTSHGNGAMIDTTSMGFDDLRNNFGMLLGKPLNGLCQQSQTEEEFMCHMDLYGAYKKREWPIFGTWVTAALLNAKNRFLPAIISPIFETPEINFTINHTSISAMPFTEIAPCGIPEEPSGSYTYSWKEGVRKYAQGCTFERDLMLDPNFGAQFWLQMLASFVGNARLTIDMGIITTAFQIGFENIRRARTEGAPIDHHKQYLLETAPFLLAAVDPEQLITYLRNLEEDIPGMDTLIFPHGKSNYLRDIQGDSQTMLVQKLSTDAASKRVMVDFADGPDSFKTIRLGDRPVHVIEFTPFYIGNPGQDSKGGMRVNPFTTNVTIGQFYPPSPLITYDGAAGCERAACSDILATHIFHQSKTIGKWEAITLRNRIENCIYYDKKTGKPSKEAFSFARSQTKQRRGSPALIPWDWNQSNEAYDRNADINTETTSNSVPNMVELNGLINKRDMRMFRNEFVGVFYDVTADEYIIPKRFGDFHLRSIPNDYIKLAGEFLEAKFREEYGHSMEDGFVHIKKLISAIRHTPWTDRYLFALLNKNVPKMIAVTGTKGAPVYKLVPEKTPLIRQEKKGKTNKNPIDQCKYKEATIIDEVKTNRFGGWDLPDKDGNMTQIYPPGFDNAVGLQTLAQEALKEGGTLWFQGGREAMEAVLFAERLHKFINKYVGKSDVINARYLPPWIHKPSGVTMLLDTIIKSAGPVHIGIPEKINYTNMPSANEVVAVTKVDLAALDPSKNPLLDAKFLKTKQNIENFTKLPVTDEKRQYIIDARTRALSCLSPEVYEKMVVIEATLNAIADKDEDVKAELYSSLHKLYDYAINLCSTNSKGSKQLRTNVEVNSLIMDALAIQMKDVFLVALNDAKVMTTAEKKTEYRNETVLKWLRTFVANVTSVNGMRKFLKEARDERDKKNNGVCPDYGEGFHDALMAYEKGQEGGSTFTLPKEGTANYNAGDYIKAAPIYNVDYLATKPKKWLRAPLASSQALRDYLREKVTPWILPSDFNTFYTYAEDHRIVTGDSTIEVGLHKNKFNLCSLARSNIFQCRLNCKKSPSEKNNEMDVESSSDDDNNDFFSSLSAKKRGSTTSSSLSMGSILRMGKKSHGDYQDEDEERDDPYYRNQMARGKSGQHYVSSETGQVGLNNCMAREYRGPWKARLAYKHKEITTKAGQFLFDAIIQSKNRAETPIKLSGAGAVILDVMIIRPFIEVKTSAILAMEAGNQTMLTTIGHSHVQVTKQSRGCWHIDVGFMMGVIKIQPNNIALIPHAFPESLIGGKNINFMTDFYNELRLANPTKPSAIAILLGPDERQFEGILHVTNGDTMVRPSFDYAIHLSKHSAGDWMEHVLGPQTVLNIDNQAMGRETYASCLSASNVLSLGPTKYIDPRTNRVHDVEGNGPMGSFIMNMPGVQDVYEGKAHRFPDRVQMYAYQNSS